MDYPCYTLPETNIAPENTPSQTETKLVFRFQPNPFSGAKFSFQGRENIPKGREVVSSDF